ncbi:response regulator [bacterium]|nr:response regulator [bacterium]MBU1883727.1 response regulator [bacterium]
MNQINEFFTMYLTETIALILAVLLILLYVIIKQKGDKPKDLKEHQELKKDEHKPVHIFSDAKIDQDEVIQEIPEVQEVEEEVLPEKKPVLKIIQKKRELTDHGPITKESFKIFDGSKILVAEDNMINQKVINGILGDSGMRIVIANDGQEALDILKEDKDFSIVLMDAHMPRVDGYEATKRIREDSSLDHLLVVALSGETSTDDIRKMYNVGMQEHLEKPLKMDKLYEVLYCYIDMKNDDLQTEQKNEDKEPPKRQDTILNIEEGIEICGGDNELYKEVLSEFLTMYEDADQKINSLMAKDQIDAVKELLLDISGISANIGADSLADITTEFREILNNNQEERFFEIQEKFKDTLSQVIGDITAHMH